MAKEGKRLRKVREKVVRGKIYDFDEACKLLASTASAKFDETVEVAVVLGVDPRKADQNVRGSVALPHGLGKSIRVAVFATGEKVKEAIKSNDTEAIKKATEALQKPLYELSAAAYQQAQASGAQGAQGAQAGSENAQGAQQQKKDDDDVIDADYTEVKDDKK